jgi:tetratricopeptide (TPR) repeat protein
MTFGRPQWLMLGAAALVTVLLVAAPRTPKGAAEANGTRAATERMDPSNAEALSPDPKVAAILAELNSGAPPMPIILKLRQLAEQEPDNVEAQWHLGLFSWQTGQYDKAMQRFRRVIALDPTGHPEAYAWMGRAYGSLDSIDQAIASYERYRSLVNGPELIHTVDSLIEQLKHRTSNAQR